MSKNKSITISLLFIMVLGIVVLYMAYQLPASLDDKTFGSGFFPKILAITLILLCVINLIQTRFARDEKIEFPGLKKIGITIASIALFYVSWTYIGLFYLNSFILIFGLSTYYGDNRSKSALITNAVVTSLTVIFLYFIFGYLLKLNL